MRLKVPAQPLVFRFAGVSSLCAAVAGLYDGCPGVRASLSLYRGTYYLAVYAALSRRPQVSRIAGAWGRALGPCGVLYSYCEEHGRCLTRNAVEELGGALRHRGT